MAGKKVKTCLLHFVLVLTSLLIGLLLGELMLRTIYDIQYLITSIQKPMGTQYTFDPLLGWRKKANYKGTLSSSEYSASYQTNSKGLRGPEYTYSKNEHTYRILVLGDSFTDGYCVDFNHLFSEVLSQKLNLQSKNLKYEVINTGVAGYSTDQELLYFETEGYKYKPDLTLLMYYETDHHQNMMPYANFLYKPYFSLEKDSLTIKGFPIQEKTKEEIEKETTWGYEDEIKLYGANPSFLIKLKIWMVFHSKLYHLAANVFRNHSTLHKWAVNLGLMSASPLANVTEKKDFTYYHTGLNPSKDYAWRLMDRILIKFKNKVDTNGGKLLVFSIPHKISIYEDEWKQIQKENNLGSEYNSNHISHCLETICKKNEIDYYYPLDEFQNNANELLKVNQRLYYKVDVHWNENGHQLAGEILSDYIFNHY